jgi:gliding motility-associated transport system permease protein
MSRTYIIFKREFLSYFDSLMAYFFLVLFLGFVNVLFIWLVFLPSKDMSMGNYFLFARVAFVIFIPAITMKAWADEKRLGTHELIMTMPVKDSEAVLGKFFASISFVVLTLVLSFLSIPTAMGFVGEADWGVIFCGYLGLFLTCTAFVAIGLSISSMTDNQFIAFIISVIIIMCLMISHDIFRLVNLPGWLSYLITYMDAGEHSASIERGVIDTRDIVYFLSVISFFLFLNYRSVTSRRWK